MTVVDEVDLVMVERVLSSFERQRVMATLGVDVVSITRGRVELEMAHDRELDQQHGFLHVGIVSTVLDTACGYAAFTVMPPDAAVLTAGFTINMMAPAAGACFRFVGEVVRAGRTLVVARGEAFSDGGAKPIASLQGTFYAAHGRTDITN